jgi:hypothetical protein
VDGGQLTVDSLFIKFFILVRICLF